MKTLKHITLLAAALFAATFSGYGATSYTITGFAPNLTLTITGTGNMPDYADAIAVPWFSQSADIETVVIEDGVNSISSYAFAYCAVLNSVTVPGSVASIGAFAFQYCSALTSITVPDGVMYIGDFAFLYCTGLTAINVNAANQNYSSENGVLFNKDTTTLICCPAGKTGAYDIPNSVESIEESAFYQCSGLTGALTIPSSVTYIGKNAFWGCTGFTAIYNYCIAPLNIIYYGLDVFRYGVDKSSCALYVPCGTAAAYRAADGWGGFTNIYPTLPSLPPAIINCEICYGTSYSDDIFTVPISEAGTYTAIETLPSGCTREVKLNLTVVKNPMQEVLDKLNEKIEDIKATLKAVKARKP